VKRLIAAAALLAATAGGVGAQEIVRTGEGDVFLDYRIDRLLRRGGYVPVLNDTTIAAGDTVRGTLFVVGAEAAVEGLVTGDMMIVDGRVFLRPGAVVRGHVYNAGGGFYPSELAHVDGDVVDRPRAPYTVRHEADRTVIRATRRDSDLNLDGVFGFHVPRYNRVDGLAVDWGARYRFLRIGRTEASVHGQVGYRTDRGALAGGGSLLLERGLWELEGGWLRETASNDRWIRGDLRNSLDFLWDSDDLRNYWQSSTGFAELRRGFGDVDEPWLTLRLRAQQEQAESLETGSPWTLLDDDSLRINPAVDDGTVRSIIPGLELERVGRVTAAEAMVEVEFGETDLDGAVATGLAPRDGSFTRLRVGAEWAMKALANHTLEIEAQTMLPLSGDEPLPRQRWGMLGGSSTIRTLENGELWGDHMAYVETEYIIPLPWRPLPRFGRPELQLLHNAGSAWVGEDDADFVQNVGARLQYFAVYVRYLIDPATDEDEWSFGVSWPFGDSYPWQEEDEARMDAPDIGF